MKIFIDTNVFLDLLLNRTEFADAAEQILVWCNADAIRGYTSSISISNIFYFVSKHQNKAEAKAAVRRLLKIIYIPVTLKKDMVLSIESNFSDFEDAVQYYSALNIEQLDYIVTRNIKDFKSSIIPVLTSEAFVKMFS